MKLKSYNKLYRRIAFLVFFVFGILILLFTLLLFLVFRESIFESPIINEHTSLIVIICVISLLIVSQGVTIFWNIRVTKPMKSVSAAISEVARGNFDVQLDHADFKNEMKELADDVSVMINELKSIEVMRSDFVSNVSHEFRAPLSSIQGYVTLMSNPAISEEQRNEYFEQLAESTRQLSGLVDNVLRLSRLESQNIVPKNAVFSLDEQLRRTVLMFEQQWSEKELVLELDLPEVTYNGNEEMTGQIWINLIGNAVKFNSHGGTLGVKIDNRDENAVTVTVYDSGEGMTEEVKKHIFEKFYQGDTSRKAEGNGLGLALVNTIKRLLGYEITVESTVGQGSSFTVKMPRV